MQLINNIIFQFLKQYNFYKTNNNKNEHSGVKAQPYTRYNGACVQ